MNNPRIPVRFVSLFRCVSENKFNGDAKELLLPLHTEGKLAARTPRPLGSRHYNELNAEKLHYAMDAGACRFGTGFSSFDKLGMNI
jgi:hypothetical protein